MKAVFYLHKTVACSSHIAMCVTLAGLAAAGVRTGASSAELFCFGSNRDATILLNAPVDYVLLRKLLSFGYRVFVCNHSSIGILGFLGAAIPNDLEQLFSMASVSPNLLIGFVSADGRYLARVYGAEAYYTPNIYRVDNVGFHQKSTDGSIHIGVLGTRCTIKNQLNALVAAHVIAASLKRRLVLHVAEQELCGDSCGAALLSLAKHSKAGLRILPVTPWPAVIDAFAPLDLMLNVSYAESFCLLPLDGLRAGVPSVVSECLPYAYTPWVARCNDIEDIVSVCLRILAGGRAVMLRAQAVANSFADFALAKWLEVL